MNPRPCTLLDIEEYRMRSDRSTPELYPHRTLPRTRYPEAADFDDPFVRIVRDTRRSVHDLGKQAQQIDWPRAAQSSML